MKRVIQVVYGVRQGGIHRIKFGQERKVDASSHEQAEAIALQMEKDEYGLDDLDLFEVRFP